MDDMWILVSVSVIRKEKIRDFTDAITIENIFAWSSEEKVYYLFKIYSAKIKPLMYASKKQSLVAFDFIGYFNNLLLKKTKKC